MAIITGIGQYFQAGGDMNRFLKIKSIEDAKAFVKMAQDFMDIIATVSYPTIAAVNGFALVGLRLHLLATSVSHQKRQCQTPGSQVRILSATAERSVYLD